MSHSRPSLTAEPDEIASLMRVQPITRLIDVRTPGEFESVHIPGSYNVPLDTLSEHACEIKALADVPVVLVCQSGMRARKSHEMLGALGMPNLRVLEGGVNGWIAAGLDVSRGRKRISLERQVRIVAGGLAAIGGLLALTVNPLFAALPAMVGSGLVFAGVTDTCAMGMLLGRMPFNRTASCDSGAVVRALTAGTRQSGQRTEANDSANCCTG